uniref:RING-type E3 ubiquitin transferase n=1 Tax=Leersia perrieri TaxID=77586 RepID=A0A0D9X922_9ORYZ
MGLLRLRARRGSNGRLPLPLLAAAAVVVVIAALVGGAAAQGSTPSGPGPNYFDPKNFNPSMAVVIVVLVTAFFFLGFFSIYIRRCSGGPLGGGGPPGEYGGAGRFMFASAAMARSTRRARGLDRAVLESFPTVAYADVKAHKGGGGGGGVVLECAVCISEFDDDEILRLLPRCSHAFHVDCIDAWLASHVTCPVCRSNLSVVDAPPPPPPVTTTATAAPEQFLLG